MSPSPRRWSSGRVRDPVTVQAAAARWMAWGPRPGGSALRRRRLAGRRRHRLRELGRGGTERTARRRRVHRRCVVGEPGRIGDPGRRRDGRSDRISLGREGPQRGGIGAPRDRQCGGPTAGDDDSGRRDSRESSVGVRTSHRRAQFLQRSMRIDRLWLAGERSAHDVVVIHHRSAPSRSTMRRRWSRALDRCDFTVPSFRPRIAAISTTLRSST